MAIINVPKTDTWEQWRVKTNALGSTMGDISTLQASSVVDYTGIEGINQSDFTGNAAEFTVTIDKGVYEVTITDDGTGYAVNDEVLVTGNLIGGIAGENDATITVTSVSPTFGITGATIAGTPASDLIAEVNQIRNEMGDTTVALTTNSTNARDAINEIEDVLRTTASGITNYDLNTNANNFLAAINEIESVLRDGGTGINNYVLDTTSNDLVAAINEHESDLGKIENLLATGSSTNADADHTITYVDLGADVIAALNALKVKADQLSEEVGGSIVTDYIGPEANILDALEALYNASSLGTLDNTYLRRSGTLEMTGMFQLHSTGMTSNGNDLLFKTGATDITAMTISASNQNVGINGPVSANYDLQVTGKTNTTTGFFYNGDDTDNRYLRRESTSGAAQTVTLDTTFTSTVDLAPSAGEVVKIGGSTVATNTLTYLEWFQDTTGAMFTGNDEQRGITAVYNDTTGKIDLQITHNSHNHLSTNITDWAEAVSDTAGYQIFAGAHNGLTATYDDNVNRITLDVNDPVLSLSGEATGSATMTNLGNTDIAVTLSQEVIQDKAAPMITGGAHTGISTTYEDGNNRINFALTADPVINLTGDASGSVTLTNLATTTFNLPVTVANDSHSHTASTLTNFTENVQDIVGAMVDPINTEAGISVTYDDATGKLNFNVSDPVIQLSGDVVGSATMTNLGSINISTTVNNDSHNHDGRYYTESEADSRFVNATGDTMTGSLTLNSSSNLYCTSPYIHFWDGSGSTWRSFQYDGANWYVEDDGGTNRLVMHSGNIGSQSVTNSTNSTYSDYTYVTRDDSTNTNYHVNFSGIGNGQQRIRNDGGLYYNPSSNTLTTSIFSGTATAARYADLAEKYLPDADYPVGTVMKVGGEKEVTATTMQSRAIGVISENPAFMMNKDLEGGVYVALKGRVPVRVLGPVSKGDELVPTSDGLAFVGEGAKVFAVALEDKPGVDSALVECVIL